MSEAVKHKDNNASLVHISLCSSHSAHQKVMSILRSERMNMTLYFLQISLFSKRLYHLVYIHHRENIPPQCFACPFFSKGKWKLMTQGKRASCCRGQNSVPLANNMSEKLENMWINFSVSNQLLFILKYNGKC